MRYVLDYDFTDAPRSFSWSLVEGDMLRALDGRYAFAPTDDGTHVDYTSRVDLAVPLPGLVKRRASGMIMGTALRDLKRAVEAEARHDEATGARHGRPTSRGAPTAMPDVAGRAAPSRRRRRVRTCRTPTRSRSTRRAPRSGRCRRRRSSRACSPSCSARCPR